MLIDFSRQLLAHGAQLVYTATREIGKTLDELKTEFPRAVFETAANEKLAYELALAGTYTGKRTACLFPAQAIIGRCCFLVEHFQDKWGRHFDL